jgi:lipid A ethanolaminephosphotransferase
MQLFRYQWRSNQVLLAAALYMTAFANLAFFRNLNATFAEAPWAPLHLLSLAIVLMCATVLLLALVTWRPVMKPVLALLFMVSATAAYFMDTYNVIIDSDMLVNVMATDAAESGDLMTPRFFAYVTLLGLLPSLALWRMRIQRPRLRQALTARLLLAGGAFVTLLALVLISSAFYAAFVREHKELRYYANPLTPVYSAYKYLKTRPARSEGQFAEIGTDAEIPATDTTRELVILVLGETARADRFSLNGYPRETNPRLAQLDVISFTDVTACGTATEISVPCMFAERDREDFETTEARSSENALDVLTHAGVNVLWRDNNSGSKGVADRIRTEDFREPETNPVCDGECRDEGMLSGLQAYIDGLPAGDILIVLHQMGSHGPAYFKRYPPRFRTFVPTCDTSQLDSCSEDEINNTYDDTILYTDHVLAEAIELLRRNDEAFETAMVYASDHGESLGESGLYLHGLPYWIAPDAQTRVPLIFWFGKRWHHVNIEAMRQMRDLPLSHDNIFHTLLGLFEIHSNVYDASADILQRALDRAQTAGTGPDVHANRNTMTVH